jgi:hypothetical protein
VEGKSYNILQLRTLVKDIALQGGFEQIKRWAGPEDISDFVFVDTPGLATSGNVKDEVLMHCLAQKSSQIVLQLLKDDELDIIIHLVLCGEASAFSVLSRTLERELGSKALDDLAERMILAITGTHRYLVNPDLKRKYQSAPTPVPAVQEPKWFVAQENKRLGPFTLVQLKEMATSGQIQASTMVLREGAQQWTQAALVEGLIPPAAFQQNPQAGGPSHEGDHFSTTLEDNILNRMGLGNRVRPARICFLDCRKFVETYGKPYDQFFDQHRATMLRWIQPGSAAYDTLKRLDLVESFATNVEALCRSDDRGQGFLIRQIIELIKEKGPFLFVKKYLTRTKLRAALKDLGKLLSRYYDENGRSNRTAIRETIQKCLHFLDPKELSTIEVFAAELDPHIDHLIRPNLKNTARRNGWIPEAFQCMTRIVFDSSIKKASVSVETAKPFNDYLSELCETWLEQWGYRSADLEFPSDGHTKHWELVKQTLKVHCREMLYQLVAADRTEEIKASTVQSTDDQEQMREILNKLSQATQLAETVCNQHGAND